MEHEIIRVASSKPPRGRLAALGARKAVTRPAKRSKTSKENTENHSAGVSVSASLRRMIKVPDSYP